MPLYSLVLSVLVLRDAFLSFSFSFFLPPSLPLFFTSLFHNHSHTHLMHGPLKEFCMPNLKPKFCSVLYFSILLCSIVLASYNLNRVYTFMADPALQLLFEHQIFLYTQGSLLNWNITCITWKSDQTHIALFIKEINKEIRRMICLF